jgi:hypothetical protein
MKTLGIPGLFIIGAVLLLYVFTIGRIWNNHSVQLYLLLCTAIISVDLGLLGLALTSKKD